MTWPVRHLVLSAMVSGIAMAAGFASAGEVQLDVTPEMVDLFATTPVVSPETAADCRYANETRATVSRRHDLDIRGESDFQLAKRSKMHADVWAIVLMRESRRTNVDPALVVGPLQESVVNGRDAHRLSRINEVIGLARGCDEIIGSLAVSDNQERAELN